MSQKFETIPLSDIQKGTIVVHKQSGIPYMITDMDNTGQVILRPDSINILSTHINNVFGFKIVKPTNIKGGGKYLRRNTKKNTIRNRRKSVRRCC